MKISEADLDRVVTSNPELGDTGFRYNSHWQRDMSKEERLQAFEAERNRLKGNYKEFSLCCEWLEGCDSRKTVNKKFESYGLKHYVERWARRRGINDNYVSNGAFIAAAIHMGFNHEPIFDSPNAYFNISSKSPVVLEDKG